jgi:hypothetical protein
MGRDRRGNCRGARDRWLVSGHSAPRLIAARLGRITVGNGDSFNVERFDNDSEQ